MESSNIRNYRITSPASYMSNYPSYSRLNGHSAWCTSRQTYLQIDLVRMYKLTSIATQGGRGPHKWVKRYKISLRAGPTFIIYNESGSQKVRTVQNLHNLPCALIQCLRAAVIVTFSIYLDPSTDYPSTDRSTK